MARVFSSGFEINSLVAGKEWATITGSPSISSTTKRSGSYSMRCNPTAATAYTSVTFLASVSSNYYARAYIYIATAPSAATLIMQFSDAGTLNAGIILNTDRTLQGCGLAKASIGSPSSALSLNTWYRVEMWASNPTTSTGSSDFKLDGVTFASHTATTPDIDNFDQLEVGIIETATADVYFDDVAINSTAAGGTQTGFPGSGQIVHLYPDGDVSLAWASITPATPTTHYDKVDDDTMDDATTYVEDTTVNNVDVYSLQSSASAGIGASDTISVVTANARWQDNSSGIASFIVGITDGTNTENSAAIDVGSSATWVVNTGHDVATTVNYRPFVTIYDDLGAGTGAISPADLDDYRLRIVNNDGDTYFVSTVYLLVEYVVAEAPSSFTAHLLSLSGVG